MTRARRAYECACMPPPRVSPPLRCPYRNATPRPNRGSKGTSPIARMHPFRRTFRDPQTAPFALPQTTPILITIRIPTLRYSVIVITVNYSAARPWAGMERAGATCAFLSSAKTKQPAAATTVRGRRTGRVRSHGTMERRADVPEAAIERLLERLASNQAHEGARPEGEDCRCTYPRCVHSHGRRQGARRCIGRDSSKGSRGSVA
jgi:hypothetical protein